MRADLNKAIADLAMTTVHGHHELSAIAAAYPDASFLRFVVHSWDSGVRLSTHQLAEFFYSPENRWVNGSLAYEG